MADLALIKKLREATGCGIADCNKALVACNDNFEDAVDWLRKKGLSSAAKKSSRNATEGLIGIAIEGNKASIVEVNSETDFVARNDKFQELVLNCAKASLNINNSNNYIGSDKAKDIALNHSGISDNVIWKRTEFDLENNIPIYEVEFYCNNMEYNYEINAINGNIIKYEIDRDY